MNHTRICALISNIPPARSPDLYEKPARVLYKRGGLATGWMRPNVHFDGNPMNLSGPLDKTWASDYVSTPFPEIYELVPCDKAGVPLDVKLRQKYFEWVKTTYSIDLACEYGQEAVVELPINCDVQPEVADKSAPPSVEETIEEPTAEQNSEPPQSEPPTVEQREPSATPTAPTRRKKQ